MDRGSSGKHGQKDATWPLIGAEPPGGQHPPFISSSVRAHFKNSLWFCPTAVLSVHFVLFSCDIRLTFSLAQQPNGRAGCIGPRGQLLEWDTADDCWGHHCFLEFPAEEKIPWLQDQSNSQTEWAQSQDFFNCLPGGGFSFSKTNFPITCGSCK